LRSLLLPPLPIGYICKLPRWIERDLRRETMKIATLVLFSVMMMSPSATLFSSPFQKDKPAEVDRAEQALRTAKGELEHAGGEWGGHRVQAMKHIDAALHELELAERWAREHHDIK
jgi:hypothetical protein